MASGSRARPRRAAPLPGVVALVVALGVALVVALGGPATGAPHAAPSVPGSPAVRLLHQTPFVRSPGGPIGVSLTRTGPATANGATVTLYLYARLTTRSGLHAAITPPGPSFAIAATRALPASCLARGAVLHLTVQLAADGVEVPEHQLCGAAMPVLRLGCSASCDGVYPLRVVVRGNGSGVALNSLVSFAKRSSTPLRVNWVLRVAGGRGALAGASPALAALAAHPRVPATLDVQGVAVAKALGAQSAAPVELLRRAALARAHELLAEPYVAADLGALYASRLQTEVIRQYELNDVVLSMAKVQRRPTPTATYGTGPETPTMAQAAASVRTRDFRISHLLVDGSALALDPSTTLSWGSAFSVAGTTDGPVALASDTVLDELSASTAADPGLVAAQFLGELAFLHFEQPNLPDPRVATVITPATAAVTASFVNQVLVGLASNPVLRAVTTSGAFAQADLGANGFPAERALALGPSAPLPAPTVSEIRFLRITTDALSSAVVSGDTPIPSIEGELLGAERTMPTPVRTAILENVHFRLKQELGHFKIVGTTLTLTESSGSLPITVLSDAPYVVQGTVLLASPRLDFPDGNAVEGVTVVPPAASVHVAAHAVTSGDLPLSVQLVSPDRRIVLAHAQIVVRATPTSIVGYALTAGAILVLALWWGRTVLARRRRG